MPVIRSTRPDYVFTNERKRELLAPIPLPLAYVDAAEVAWQTCGSTTADVDATDAASAALDLSTDGMLEGSTQLSWCPVPYVTRAEALEATKVAKAEGRTSPAWSDYCAAFDTVSLKAENVSWMLGHYANSPGRRLGEETAAHARRSYGRYAREVTKAKAAGLTLSDARAKAKARRKAAKAAPEAKASSAARTAAARRRTVYVDLLALADRLGTRLPMVHVPTADDVAAGIVHLRGLDAYRALPAAVRSGHSRALKALLPELSRTAG